MDSQLVTILLVIAAVGTAIAVVSVRSRGFRRPRWQGPQHWATVHGWTSRSSDRSVLSRFSAPPFGQGSDRQTSDVLTGTWNGIPATSFWYQYSTWSRTRQIHHSRHVMALMLPARLPWLQLEPEGFSGVIGPSAPGREVTLESAEFNARWDVRGPEGRSSHDFLHSRMMSRLLQPDAAGVSICVDGANLVAVRAGFQDPDRIEPTLALLGDLVALVPRFVWHDAGHRPQG